MTEYKISMVFFGLLLLQLSSVLGNPCVDNTGILFVPDDESCDGYFTCVDDEAFPQTCPEGFYFDFEAQLCNPADQVDCNEPTINPCEGLAQWTFVPRPEGGCGAYYRCDNGVGVPLDCPYGFYFDVVGQKCNFEDLIDCDSNGNGGIQTPPEETPTTTTNEPTTTLIPTAPTAPSTTPPPIELSCVSRPDGAFIPDPSRGCTAFLRCENGLGIAHFCDAPFYFDYYRQMCNWQEYVDCVS